MQNLLMQLLSSGRGRLVDARLSGLAKSRAGADRLRSYAPYPKQSEFHAAGVRHRHVSGGTSIIAFKSYEKGREKWQGETLHRVWFDEEPPHDIYTEGLTRTNATGGMVWLTLTPLLGMSEVVRSFLDNPTPDR